MPLKEGPKQLKQSGRSSKNSLAYLGVAPDSPSNFKTFDKDPTPQDYKNWEVGDEWENRTTKDVWKLVEKKRTGLNTAEGIWVKFANGSGNSVSSLKDDAGNVVIADGTGAITVQGGDNINTTNPVANTLAVNLNKSIIQPDTNASGSEGLYTLGTTEFISNYGTDNAFLGGAGNRTLTVATAVGNTAVGKGALASITEGTYNIAVGAGALDSNTTGSKNIAIGFEALGLNTTGVDNVAIGDNALTVCTTGLNNVAIGLNALDSLTNGVSNVAIGNNALGSAVTPCSHAIAIGSGALESYVGATIHPNVTGNNIAIGWKALSELDAQENNIAIGTGALGLLVSGAGNIGGQNHIIGELGAPTMLQGQNNTGLGWGTFYNVQRGGTYTTDCSYNIAIGSSTGWYWTDSESGNIAIGSGCANGENNTIRIGNPPNIPDRGGGWHDWDRQDRCFIAGIRGVTTDVADAIPVVIDSNGQLGTAPSNNIAFFANLKDSLLNFTGNAEDGPIIFEQEIFDLSSNYDHTTGIFTAPREGIYYLHAVVDLTNITIGNRSYIKILTTNGAFHGLNKNTSAIVSSTGYTGTQLSCLAYMAIGDTARINIVSTGEAAKTQTVAGSVASWPTGNAITYFEGHIVTAL